MTTLTTMTKTDSTTAMTTTTTTTEDRHYLKAIGPANCMAHKHLALADGDPRADLFEISTAAMHKWILLCLLTSDGEDPFGVTLEDRSRIYLFT